MSPESAVAAYAAQYPHKTILVRTPAWSGEQLLEAYLNDYKHFQDQGANEAVIGRIKSDLLILREPEMHIFMETNAQGLIGPDIDFSKKLIGVWGDSVVEGYGPGWVMDGSDLLPGYHMLNGGVGGATIAYVALRAIEMNKRLPCAYNIVFPGLNTMFYPVPAIKLLYFWLHRLIDALPNVILCTQPTSLNAQVIGGDFSRHVAQRGQLQYRAGYRFWHEAPPAPENVRGMFDVILRQNEIVWRVARERWEARGQHIPVIDLYALLDSSSLPDFREHFADAGHFREESYPFVWNLLCEELAQIIAPA